MKEPAARKPAPNQPSAAVPRSPGHPPGRRTQARSVLLEGVLVALAGALFAFAVNAVSPRGLALARNYFPDSAAPPTTTTTAVTAPPSSSPGTTPPVYAPANPLAARLQAKGLQLVESNEVAQLFRDPRYDQELILFIDARDDRHYQEGHIPGAYPFDHYRPQNYLASVIPACQAAERIVVYCTGGDCEDSEFAAIFLQNAGIPREKIFVYGGGITEWTANRHPVETGARRSGNYRPVNR